jgi:hypothetical protein
MTSTEVICSSCGALVDGFVATLAPERAARVLAAPDVDEIVSLAGRPAVG